jgi:hypothetical protein
MYKEYRGAVHIHSDYSDGTGRVEEIITDARECGLDFIILSDHDTLEAKHAGWEGWHEGVLVAVGVEVSPPDRGHCLALNIHDVDGYKYMREDEIVRRAHEQGAYIFVVHPQGKRKRSVGINLESWQYWELDEIVGIEIWSFMHDWIEDFSWWKVAEFYKRPHSKITGPDPGVMQMWDTMCMRRKMTAIGGLDVHASKLFTKRIRFFPYRSLFNSILTHVLCEEMTGNTGEDLERLYQALIAGRCFVAYDELAPARGFRFCASADDGVFQMGEDVPLGERLHLTVELPQEAELRVIKDGAPLQRLRSRRFSQPVREEGIYRIEAYVEGRPWIFSNPLYVRKDSKGVS